VHLRGERRRRIREPAAEGRAALHWNEGDDDPDADGEGKE
jgi:hypothetical protein